MNHHPVLLSEVLETFEGKSLHNFFDATVGAGGHAQAILEKHTEIKLYIGCDRDPKALEIAEKILNPWKEKIYLLQGNFSHIPKYLQEKNVTCVDGILFDFGLSSMQLDDKERGFSFYGGPLDMRMDPANTLTAEDVVNELSEKKLGYIFRDFGEERHWRSVAKRITIARKKKRITRAEELVKIIRPVLGKRQKIHPATRIFQALRIFVNDEPIAIKQGVKKAVECLCEEQRIAVISFHSLEDRLIKHIFRDEKDQKNLLVLTKKPLVATEEERRKNPRSRSAKMRVGEKNRKDYE